MIRLRSGFTIAAVAVGAALLSASACAPKASVGASGTSRTTQPTTPHIDKLDPDSGSVAGGGMVRVTIRGSGFAPGTPGTNTIDFAGMMIKSVAANAAGTEIVFTVPNRLNLGGSPPMAIQPGAYDVRIITTAGESNKVAFKVFR